MKFASFLPILVCLFTSSGLSAQTPPFDYEVEVLDLNTTPVPLDQARTTFSSENGVYFEIPGRDDQNPRLYYYDGATTQLVYSPEEALPSSFSESIGFSAAFNDGVLFFVARESTATQYKYFFHKHGSQSAVELELLRNGLFPDHVIIGNRLVGKSRGGSRIISTNGSVAGTRTLVESGLVSSTDFIPYQGGVLAHSDQSLYLTDGTVAGTTRLGDMERFPGSGPVVAGDNYYYTSSRDLFAFNLSTNVNIQLTNNAGTPQDQITESEALTANGDQLIFVAENDANGTEVWSSDGTVAGTEVYDRVPGTASGVLGDPISVFGQLYFETPDSEVFVSDGTASGTVPALTLNGEIANAANWRLSLITAGSTTSPAYLLATSLTPRKSEIFSKASSTAPLLSVGFIDDEPDYLEGYEFTDNGFYFLTTSDLLCYTSSLNNSTTAIGAFGNFYRFLGHIDEKVLFTRNLAFFTEVDVEPYAAGPEPGSIEFLGDLFPGVGSSRPSSLVTLDGTVYFNAYNSATFNNLYTTDGTAAGTSQAVNLSPGTRSSSLTDPVVAGGRLYFNKDGRFWSSNGTVASSVDLQVQGATWQHIGTIQDTAYFRTQATIGVRRLVLRTNGTPSGSEVIELLRSEQGGSSNSTVVLSDGRIYFWEFDLSVTNEITSRLVSTNTLFTDHREQLVTTLPATTAFARGNLVPVDGGMYIFRGDFSQGPDELLFLNHETDMITTVRSDVGAEASTTYSSGASSSEKIVFLERVTGATSAANNAIMVDQNRNTFLVAELNTSTQEEIMELFDFTGFTILATSQRLIKINDDNSVETIYENEKLRSFTRYKNNQLLFSIAQSTNNRSTWITDGTTTEFFVALGGGNDDFIDYLGDPDYALTGPYIANQEEIFNFTTVSLYNTLSESFNVEPQPNPETAYPSSVVAYQGNFFFVATDPILGREIHVINFNYAKGVEITAYHDQNENGAQDEGELGILNIGFTAASATRERRAFTNENGQAEIELEVDSTFTITPSPATCWELISLPASNEVTFRTGERLGLDYGYRLTGGTPNLNLLLSSAQPRCGFTVPFWLTVQNTGCVPLSGQASITLPEDVQFVSSIDASMIDGQTISWPYADLPPNGIRQFQLFLTMPGEQSNGMVIPINSQAFALNPQNDTIATGAFEYRQVLSCAIDPNDKQVLPARIEPSNRNYTQIDETLIYTIRFQNTGTDTAFTVLITDQLPRRLDFSSFKPLTASHPYSASINGDDVEFLFENIMLPDSNTNEVLSHGFVSFEVELDQAVAIGATIRNRANIYFDYNSAIRTNRTASAIVEFLDEDEDGFLFYEECDDQDPTINPDGFDIAGNGIDENCDGEDSPVSTTTPLSGQLSIFPNPAYQHLNLTFSDDRELIAQLYDLLGREHNQLVFRSNGSLQLGKLPAGTYLLKVTDVAKGETTVQRIIHR